MTREERERAERLRAYKKAAEGVEADWDGCSTWPAQWVSDETGVEFDWPVYASEEEGRALIEDEGGLVAIWERVARQAGMRRVRDYALLGDVGVIQTDTRGQVGGIFSNGGVFNWRSTKAVRVLAPRAFQWEPGPDGPVFRPIVLGVWRV